MNRFLLLALTAGLLSSIAANANISNQKKSLQKACLEEWKKEIQLAYPNKPITPEEESVFKEACLCFTKFTKNTVVAKL